MAIEGCRITTKAMAIDGAFQGLLTRSLHAEKTKGVASKSRLLGLAAELRNRIYELAVVVATPIAVGLNVGDGHLQQPALTRTCRQVRHECLPIFYDSNTFRLYRDLDRPQARQLDLDLTSGHTDKIQHFQFQLCFHRNYYELDLSNGLQHFVLKMVVEMQRFDPFHKSAGCFVNSAALSEGLQYLQSLVDKGLERLGVTGLEALSAKLMQTKAILNER